MAFHNHPNYRNNHRHAGFGIGPHDFVQYTYGTGGGSSSNNIVQIDYYVGGQQSSGTLVATVVHTYDSGDNVITSERTS